MKIEPSGHPPDIVERPAAVRLERQMRIRERAGQRKRELAVRTAAFGGHIGLYWRENRRDRLEVLRKAALRRKARAIWHAAALLLTNLFTLDPGNQQRLAIC